MWQHSPACLVWRSSWPALVSPGHLERVQRPGYCSRSTSLAESPCPPVASYPALLRNTHALVHPVRRIHNWKVNNNNNILQFSFISQRTMATSTDICITLPALNWQPSVWLIIVLTLLIYHLIYGYVLNEQCLYLWMSALPAPPPPAHDWSRSVRITIMHPSLIW